MTQYATWASYSGDARTWLSLGLLAAAVGAVLAGLRLPLPVRFSQPGPCGRTALMVAWGTSITALLICATIYFRQVATDIQASGRSEPALRLTILPVTLTAAAALFTFIVSRRSADLPTRKLSAVIGAIAAPMIFELPFDPLVIFRFQGVVPGPPPWALVYPPLLLVEITTLLLLRLSPMVRLTRATFFSFVASKLLAFAVAFTLFLPQRSVPGQEPMRAYPAQSTEST